MHPFQATYCDRTCQKIGWKTHKLVCGSKRETPQQIGGVEEVELSKQQSDLIQKLFKEAHEAEQKVKASASSNTHQTTGNVSGGEGGGWRARARAEMSAFGIGKSS